MQFFQRVRRQLRSPASPDVGAYARRAVGIATLAVLCVAPAAIVFAEGPPPAAPTAASASVGAAALTAQECRSLYEHQLSLIASDPDNPLHAALGVNAAAMQSAAARDAEARRCVERITRAGFECQLAARSLAELLQCRSRVSETQAPGETDRPPAETGGAQLENLPGGRLAVTPETCRRAYDRIFSVMTSAPGFADRRDREQLLARWQSPEAKASFERRCTSKFQPADLGCILSTEDPDVIQGCLLVIPEES